MEVAGLDLHGTELVVLSACDTGLGETRIDDDFMKRNIGRSDGVYGLRRALVLAGAKTQMVSLWRVADVATRSLMTAYYDKLARGVGRSQALREVQQAFLASKGKDRDWSHPKYWASFIVAGSTAPMTGELARPALRPGHRGPARLRLRQQRSPGHPGRLAFQPGRRAARAPPEGVAPASIVRAARLLAGESG